MKIGNAPVSWGVFEVESGGHQLPWSQVLSEIRATGYNGTELGPWGYLPTDPDRLADELRRRGLVLASAFHPVAPRGELAEELRRADAVAELLARLGCQAIVLACAQTDDRAGVAGRVGPEHALGGDGWTRFVDLVRRVAERAGERGLQTHFHHHAGTYIETPEEIDRLLQAVPADVLGLCLDTGHFAFGGGDPSLAAERYGTRIGYLHLKDIRRAELEDARRRGLPFMEAVRAGVFCELGLGDANVELVVRQLIGRGYDGWCIVEQDRIVAPDTPVGAPRRSAEISRRWLRNVMERQV